MAQFDIYPNPGLKKTDIPFLVVVQNNHITSRTGAAVVIPLRANTNPVETMAPLVDVPGKGQFVLSTDEIFAIDIARLKHSVGALSPRDRAKIKPAVDKPKFLCYPVSALQKANNSPTNDGFFGLDANIFSIM